MRDSDGAVLHRAEVAHRAVVAARAVRVAGRGPDQFGDGVDFREHLRVAPGRREDEHVGKEGCRDLRVPVEEIREISQPGDNSGTLFGIGVVVYLTSLLSGLGRFRVSDSTARRSDFPCNTNANRVQLRMATQFQRNASAIKCETP